MYRVAIVEDSRAEGANLASCLKRYGIEKNEEFHVLWYQSSEKFMSSGEKPDLIFMDIELPGASGMDAAALLRTYDPDTPLVFVTNLAQYALRGYEVDALDFVVKPVAYTSFRTHMAKVMRALRHRAVTVIAISIRGETSLIQLGELSYAEVIGHSVTYHLAGGRPSVIVRSTLREASEELPQDQFVRVNNSSIANMAHVIGADSEKVTLRDGTELYFSRSRRLSARKAIASYLGGSI